MRVLLLFLIIISRVIIDCYLMISTMMVPFEPDCLSLAMMFLKSFKSPNFTPISKTYLSFIGKRETIFHSI